MSRKPVLWAKWCTWTLAAVLAVALAVPALAEAPSVAGTQWSGTATFLFKVKGHGKKTETRQCTLTFYPDGALGFRCADAGDPVMKSLQEDADGPTWSQHGKRIRISWPSDTWAEHFAWVYGEVTGQEPADVTAATEKARAKLRPKKETMKYRYRGRGKVVGEDGKTARTSFKVVMKDLHEVKK